MPITWPDVIPSSSADCANTCGCRRIRPASPR